MLGKAAFITNGTWMENEMQDAPREDGFEFAMAPIPTENADDVHYVFDSCEQFSIPAAAKNQELAKEFLRFLYSDESVSAFAEASGALYATKSAREVAKDKLSTAIYNMYGIYDEANASSLIMSFSAVPADCKINPKDEIFNPITSVMNDESRRVGTERRRCFCTGSCRSGSCQINILSVIYRMNVVQLSEKAAAQMYAAAFFYPKLI